MPTNTVIPPQTGAPSAPDAQTSKLERWLARPLGDPDPKRFGSGVGFLLGWWVTWRNTGCTAHVTASGRGGRFTRCRELDWLAGSRLHLVDVEMTRAAVLLPIFGSVSSRRRSMSGSC